MKIHNYINYAQQTTKYTYEICFGGIASGDREKLKNVLNFENLQLVFQQLGRMGYQIISSH